LSFVILAFYLVIPALYFVIPALYFVIPAQAGIQQYMKTRLDSRVRGNDR